MIAVMIVALAAGVAAFVLAPLRRPAPAVSRAKDDQERRPGDDRAAVEALHDLELDRATGKLNNDDYAHLRARYEAPAREGLRSAGTIRSAAPPEGGDAV